MNKTILYVLAAVIGVGLAVALFPKSEAPDVSVDLEQAAKERNSKAPVMTYDPNLAKRTEKTKPTVEQLEEDSKRSGKPNDVAIERMKRDASVTGQHLKQVQNRWQGLGLELERAGLSEEGTEARAMMKRIADLRRESDVDLDALLAEEEELLGKLTASANSAGVTTNADAISDSIAEARAGAKVEAAPAD